MRTKKNSLYASDTATLKDSFSVSHKAKHSLPYDPAITLLDTYLTDL